MADAAAATAAAAIHVGDRFPDAELAEGTPKNKVTTHDLFAGKRVVVFGVPGAFTPTCHSRHLPGYIEDVDKYREKGVEVVCISVNDAFVMDAWCKATGAEGKIRFLADASGLLAEKLGLVLHAEAALGNKRLRRFSALVDDGVVAVLYVEPDGGGASVSLSENMLQHL